MIRQAISCDICGAEKRQTNHWFMAWEHGGELRVTGWSARTRLRAGARHLCGQACLHKLADDFMERIITRGAKAGDEQDLKASRASPLADQFESSARLIPAAEASSGTPRPATLIHMQDRLSPDAATPPHDSPRYTSRSWHAEAWLRERERNQQSSERRPESTGRRISQS